MLAFDRAKTRRLEGSTPTMQTSAPTRVRYGVLGFTLALTAIAYLDRVCIATAAPAMKADLGLSDVQMGYVFSAFTLAYALFEVPSGWLADRFGARLMVARIVIWWSLLTAATGWVGSFASLVVVRFLFGAGEAGTFPSIARAYGRWLSAAERGRAFGLALMTAALGGAVTQPLVVQLLEVMHWRHTFPIFGAVGIVFAMIWYAWFRDDPRDHAWVNEAEVQRIGAEVPPAHSGVPWAEMMRSRNLWVVCGMYFSAIYGWYFYITWLPTYLLKARGLDLKAVGWLAALPLLAIAGGVALGGWLSDVFVRRWGRRAGRRITGLIGLPLAAVAVVGGLATESPTSSALCFAAAAGLAAMGVSPAWAVCLEIGGQHAGVVTGAMNMFGNLGGAVSPVVIGFCLERWGSWNISLLTVSALYLVAAACWLAIDPDRPIFAKPEERARVR